MLPWEGAALWTVLSIPAGSTSHQVIRMQRERSALTWIWWSSCCAASGRAGTTLTATSVSHPLRVVSLPASPRAQGTCLGTFSRTEAMLHRVTNVDIIIPSYHPGPKVGSWLWDLFGWAVIAPKHYQGPSQPGGTDNRAPGPGRGPCLLFSSPV